MKLTKLLFISALAFSGCKIPSYAMDSIFPENTKLEKRLQRYMSLSPQEIYNTGVELRKGQINGYDEKETLQAAFLCFQKVFFMSLNDIDKTLWGKAAHNLGNIYYIWKQPQQAAKMFILGISTGLEQSKRNLEKLQEEKALPEPKQPNLVIAEELENEQKKIANEAINLVHMMDTFETKITQQIPQIVEGMLSKLNKNLDTEYTPLPKQKLLTQKILSDYQLKTRRSNGSLTTNFLSQ